MKSTVTACITTLVLVISLFSCGSDEDATSVKSRTITFEITGNFTGTIIASHTTATGGTINEQITLPWKQDITFATNVDHAIIGIGGSGGSAGQSITVVIKRGSEQLSSTPVTAGSNGTVSASSPVVSL